jgi:hypothetical protein
MTDHAVLSRSRRSGVARLWRGWIVAVLAVLLAAGGHQIAHSIMHGTPDAIAVELLGFAAAVTAPIAVALAGRRIAVWSTGLTTVFGQVVFHFLYSLPYSGAAQHAATHTGPGAPTDTLVMLVAHLLAAAITTWIIVYGERSLVRIVSWLMLVPVKLVLAAQLVSFRRPKSLLPVGRVWIPRPMNIAQTRWTRGPPALA